MREACKKVCVRLSGTAILHACRIEFEKAIEIDDPPSAAEGLNLEQMNVPETYDGIRLGDSMTEEFVQDMIARFKDQKQIHQKYVFQIILAVTGIIKNEPTMVEFDVDRKLTICGDTHGKSCNGIWQYLIPRSIFRPHADIRHQRTPFD